MVCQLHDARLAKTQTNRLISNVRGKRAKWMVSYSRTVGKVLISFIRPLRPYVDTSQSPWCMTSSITPWPVLISRPAEGKRLSWPERLVTCQEGIPADRRSAPSAVWRSGNALVSINEVNLRWARLVMRWITVTGFDSSLYFGMLPATQVDSAFYPPWDGKISTNQRAMMLYGWGVKADMACLQVKLCDC